MYFKLLETFVLKILFARDEYNISSKNFNPVRLVLISLLVLNVPFSVYLLNKIEVLYTAIEKEYPGAIKDLHEKRVKEKLVEKAKK